MGGGKVSSRLAEGPQVCAVSCFRGPSLEQRTLVSQRRAHQGYEGWGREEEEGPVRRSVPGQRVVGRGAKLSGHHWLLSVSLGSAGGSRDRSLIAGCLVVAASWVFTRGLDTRVSLPGL